MKTAQEILLEEKLSRMDREAKEKSWTELTNRCRTSNWPVPFWYQLFGFLLISAFLHFNRPGDYRNVLVLAALFVLWSVPTYFRQRRGTKALLKLIEREAPELYRKLEHEKIA